MLKTWGPYNFSENLSEIIKTVFPQCLWKSLKISENQASGNLGHVWAHLRRSPRKYSFVTDRRGQAPAHQPLASNPAAVKADANLHCEAEQCKGHMLASHDKLYIQSKSSEMTCIGSYACGAA